MMKTKIFGMELSLDPERKKHLDEFIRRFEELYNADPEPVPTGSAERKDVP
jgi:hypothetical protein